MSIEQRYTGFEKAKNYTKQYELDAVDAIVTKQEDGYLGYISAGQFATTGSNIFTGGQIIVGNLTIDGNIFANTFNVTTTSIEHFTASTNFGLDEGDTHTFTGSVRVSGSVNTIGNSTITGSLQISGSEVITGSLSISGAFYYNGHKQYNYGQFYDMTSQSGSSGSIQSMKLNTTDLSEGVSIVSGSQIKVQYDGVYNLQFSVQLENTVNTNIVFNIWFAKNGTPIPDSNTHVDVARAQSAQLGKVPAAWNFLAHLNANDYLEIKWTCNDNGGILHYDAGTATIPATPSVIVTMTQIA